MNTSALVPINTKAQIAIFVRKIFFYIKFNLHKLFYIGKYLPCDPNPCANRGVCITPANATFECQCPEYYYGATCRIGKCLY